MPKNASDLFMSAIDKKTDPVYMSAKSDIIQHYLSTYGDKWTRRIAEDLHGSIKNKKGEDVSVRNIQRRFQGKRLAQGEGRSGNMYKELGQKLPPIGRTLRDGKITITVQADQRNGKHGARPREWEATFTGSKAQKFINNPTLRDVLQELDYDEDIIDMLEDGDYMADIYAVG